MAILGWKFQKTCLNSLTMEVTGKCHPSLGEASAHLQEILQSFDIHTDIH